MKWSIVKSVFKKEAKITTVYWAEIDGSQVIGSRHFLFRMQFVPNELRAILAECGITEVNTAITNGVVGTPPKLDDLVKQLHDTADMDQYDNTGLTHTSSDGKHVLGLLATHDDKWVAIKSHYLEMFNELFPNQSKHFKGGVTPIICHGVGILFPMRLPDTHVLRKRLTFK